MLDWAANNVGLVAAVTAFLSAVATIAAAVATWRAPRSGAELAERLRRDSELAHETRRMKLWVFTTLMQERAAIYSPEAVRALNVIDVVFHECVEVREAWAELYLSLQADNHIPEHEKTQRIRLLLKAMAASLGLSSSLRLDDFGRVYYPNALAEENEVQAMERRARRVRLMNEVAPPSTVSQSMFPPRPNGAPALNGD
jgi:hypothetical protein